MTKANRAAIYCRISDDRGGEGLGVARQQEDCEKLAKQLGWEVAHVLIDNDRSAFTGRTRPGYQQLLEGLRDGTYDGVLAWHADRLHRRPIELEDYIHICQTQGVRTHTVKGGEVDLATPEGMLRAGMLGQIARYESAHRSDRMIRAHQQAAEQGKWRGGTRPFGYLTDGTTLHPTEAPAVREAYESVLRGDSLNSIVRHWAAQGFTSARGKPKTVVTLKGVLLRERNFGASLYKGEIVKRDAFEAIVTEDVFMAAKAILTDPKRKKNVSSEGKWLLSGIARCSLCKEAGRDGKMQAKPVNTNRKHASSIYSCRECKKLGRNAPSCDAYIRDVIFEYLSRPDAINILHHGNDAEVGELRDKAEGLRAKLAEYATMFAEDAMTSAQFRDASAITRARLKEAERLLFKPGQEPGILELIKSPDMGATWEGMTWARKRKVVVALMDITILPRVKPGPGFDASRVEVVWH